MSAAEFFVFPRTICRMYAGPLGPFIDAFADQLQQRGYSRRSIRYKIQTAANFSHWLKRHSLNADDRASVPARTAGGARESALPS